MAKVIPFEERAVAHLRERLGEAVEANQDLIAFARGHSGAVASIHLQGGVRHLNGFSLTVRGTEGMIEASSPGNAQATSVVLRGLRGREPALEELAIGDTYARAPAELMDGPAFNVAQLYVELERAIAEGRPASPDFGLAVRRHLLLDAIEQAAQTGMRTAPRAE